MDGWIEGGGCLDGPTAEKDGVLAGPLGPGPQKDQVGRRLCRFRLAVTTPAATSDQVTKLR